MLKGTEYFTKSKAKIKKGASRERLSTSLMPLGKIHLGREVYRDRKASRREQTKESN